MRSKAFISWVFALLALTYVLTDPMARAHAQSSLGIGTNDAIVPTSGHFGAVFQWINAHQQSFYRSLTGALKAMRDDGSELWLLIGLSFAYGVFHAAGPGHGKAIISSYMLANEVALKRGVLLSFVSAILQAAAAILLMSAIFLVLRGSSIRMTDAAWALEITSYAAITAFGSYLLWQKLAARVRDWHRPPPTHSLSAASAFACEETHGTGMGKVCAACGHAHAPDPAMLAGDRFDWKTAWAAIAAVGIRPCSGALIVLTFSFLNGLWIGGILSVLAMALGTGITVAMLATMAVTAKNWAVRMSGEGRAGDTVGAVIEIGGAAMVMLLGMTLLAASLSA